MDNARRMLVGTIGSLLIVVTGLFLVCAVQREATRVAPRDEEAYKRELVELLGLEDELTPAPAETVAVEQSPEAEAPPTEAPRVDNAAAAELFDLLEQLDRLRTLVDQREQEIAKLEQESAGLDAEINKLVMRLANLRTGDSRLATKGTGVARVTVRIPAGAQASLPSAAGSFEQRYERAIQLFNERAYAEARSIFAQLLREYPEHRLADNCQYWIGECLFGEKRYLEALAAFSKVFAFDATDKYDDAQIMIALCYIRMGVPERARVELQDFLKFYPKSEYVATARSYLARLSA